ncbi:MAG: hypothetical protein AAFU61_09125, partial [Pseudomonadota bacterium]
MKIVLHIGLHRTGTTALTVMLERARARLLRRGVRFESTATIRQAVTAHLAAAASPAWTLGLSRARARSRIRDWAAAREAEGTRRLILSDEVIPGSMDRCLTPAGLYPEAAARLTLL